MNYLKNLRWNLLVGILFYFPIYLPAQNNMFRPELGVCTKVQNIPLLEQFGYQFIQPSAQDFLMPKDGSLPIEIDSKLPVFAVNSFLPSEMKVVGPQANPEVIIAYADTLFRRARQAGVKVVVFGSGNARKIPPGFDREQAEQQLVDLCIELAKLAEQNQLILCLENLNSGETNLVNTVQEAHDIALRVNHPNFKLLVDIFHMLREGESPSSILEAGAYYVYHIDIAEKENRTAPGMAGDDFRPYLRALRDISYSGKIALESGYTDIEAELPKAMKELTHQLNTL